ncbi:MAG: pyridoxal-dependent decarboxylase, exosortase A system-associated [Gammaproteobacteria bacterium]|nr:MAG: pyridoxal-dependent decarboxylase, exosortase A system-associated [Gammaproteobacteria bacterium]
MEDKTPLKHQALKHLKTIDNHLEIDGNIVKNLAIQAGSVPFYAYDRSAIERRLVDMRARLPEQLFIHYAIKANPMPALVQFLSDKVDGFDVASVKEMEIALDSGMSSDFISFAGPGKTQHEIEAGVAAGITFHVESETELKRIIAAGKEQEEKPKVAIRVNPEFELKSSGMQMGGGPKQFGIDAEKVPALLRMLDPEDAEFIGFHIFSGSQNLKEEAIIESQQKAVDLAIDLARHAKQSVVAVNIGGGFGIPYFPGEKSLDLDPIAKNLENLLEQMDECLPGAQLIIELGRYIVGEAGYYVCEVIDKKVSRGEIFLITNGGLHHHLAASGNFGQVIRKNYPLVVGNRVYSEITDVVNVVGPLCTPLDILATKMELPYCEPGDYIVVLQSGAYGYSASPHGFLSHPAPAELLV